jgi:phage gpG-like protein
MGIEFAHKPLRIEDFQYELRAVGRRATHLHPVMEDIADLVLDRERRLFETRGASSGVYWSPLKGTTIKRKIREGVDDPFAPLRRKDELMKSLSERDAEFQELEVTDDSFYLATSHPSAEFHAEGTANMAARPPLIIPKKHAQEYMKMIQDFVFGGEDV